AKDFQKKRDKLCGVLENIGFSPYIPQGAYYVLADISILPGKSSKEKVMYLLEKTGVACVPGEAFYHDDYGQNLARFCFAKEDTVLDEACERLKRSKI
ncbi:MAG: aminotransferase class I/II-fold pyridoxal phosphate-dependent enzyme, partial [Candidatus Aminicenantes bacterium]|nr:aminotransferase class I/II-fold pyridoxal phosphate-dependent enzyme [Candidatus Aminicenantes bacterium]